MYFIDFLLKIYICVPIFDVNLDVDGKWYCIAGCDTCDTHTCSLTMMVFNILNECYFNIIVHNTLVHIFFSTSNIHRTVQGVRLQMLHVIS